MVAANTNLRSIRDLPEENRTWPVRVYTLGRFDVLTYDKPLAFSGRVQKKPIELLHTLIAFGGRGVAAIRMAQALWPNAEVDRAKHALETALYRLRKLLGDRCIHMNGGHLTLNSDWCWVDIWDFERLLDLAEDATFPAMHTQRLFEFYQGPFLDGDDTPSVLIQRERIRSKFFRTLCQLGRILESRAQHQVAIECYRKGIEADPLAEEVYRCLMQCFRDLNCPAEALAIYLRCQKTLASVLGIEPAPETEALYREIQGHGVRRMYVPGK